MTVLKVCGIALSLLLFLLQIADRKGPNGRSVVFAAALLFFSASLMGINEIFTLVSEYKGLFDKTGYTALC